MFFTILGLEEWIKVRDMNGAFVVLDFFGRVGCSVDGRLEAAVVLRRSGKEWIQHYDRN
jgi:hypothetical protein